MKIIYLFLSSEQVRFRKGRQIPCQERTQLQHQIKRSKASDLATSAFKMPDKTAVSQRTVSSKQLQSLYFLRTYLLQCWDVCPHPGQVKEVLLVEDSWLSSLWAWCSVEAHQHFILSLENCSHLSLNCWFGVWHTPLTSKLGQQWQLHLSSPYLFLWVYELPVGLRAITYTAKWVTWNSPRLGKLTI